MNGLLDFLANSYTSYHAAERAAALLKSNGFTPLYEGEAWSLKRGGKYYTVRNGGSLIAFTLGEGNSFKIIASHTDSPCFKLKENPAMQDAFTKLNAETYGGGLWYTFFDRPLKIAGRVVSEEDGKLCARIFTSDYAVCIPSLAVHMNRDANEKFSPDLQKETLPLFALGRTNFTLPDNVLSYDLFAAPAQEPFCYGANGEFVCAPRVDNLASVFSSLVALCEDGHGGICVAACLDNEEIGSRTRQGAGSDFLQSVLRRISRALGFETEYAETLSSSFLISLDNAHSLHPNYPEKCDPTNRAVMGGGVAIKNHAGGAYTSDAFTTAIVKQIFRNAGVKYQSFYNRSDMRSGGTLGSISFTQVSVPSVDLGLPQLAMHSAMETFCKADYTELERGLKAFYQSSIILENDAAIIQ